MVDILFGTLKYEAAAKGSGGDSKLRSVKEEEEEVDKPDQLVKMVKKLIEKKLNMTKLIRCWNCGEVLDNML